ncbi:transcriptional activator xlnR [Stachybotrys elegans]|uniref:Transcriptional activator xlnR n=1 Tax=Stachybotrys elegans TaxID=80388 RepID=A0A8K0T0R8_9HYPO|nr:transcriptional activator xlnR [Stachybotrys elegans]
MLSNPLQRFSPYNSLSSSSLMSNNHAPQNHMHSNGLDMLGQNSHYALQQLHQYVGVPSSAAAAHDPKHRHHPYGAGARSASTSGPVRRRISRACDQCNQLRTKCDGQHPCAHCIEFGLGCEYIRERKKRGKASRKDLAQQAAAQAAAAASGRSEKSSEPDKAQPLEKQGDAPDAVHKAQQQTHREQSSSIDEKPSTIGDDAIPTQPTESLDGLDDLGTPAALGPHSTMDRGHMNGSASLDLNGFGNVAQGFDGRPGMGNHLMESHQPYAANQPSMSSYPDLTYSLQNQGAAAYNGNPVFRMCNSPLSGYHMGASGTPQGWGVSMASPPAQFGVPGPQSNINHGNLRYPVLEPLIPHLGNIIPINLACDLIDLYFSSSSSAQMHPMSPYVLGFVFRKRAFLHPTKPRHCQPALLASMLWVAAQTSDAPFITSVPSARSKICQKLLELTVGLLKPLIHTSSSEASPVMGPIAEGVSLGGLGVALPGSISMEALTGEFGAFGAAGNLDDVVTYIHLATVVSASEYKGASLRWWNAAWSLARELKLGRELPPNGPPMNERNEMDGDAKDEHDFYRNHPGFVTEEEREERRRIWWLVYIVDRHLALCYNRPLFFLDVECDGLYQPMDDTAWQNGEFGHGYTTRNTDPNVLSSLPDGAKGQEERVSGLSFQCTGHSIFGYFLPLMAILGEIVDLHHAKHHPRFGVIFRSTRAWDKQAAEISRHLETYEQSLKAFEQRHLARYNEEKGDHSLLDTSELGVDANTPSVHSVHTTTSSRMTESDIQTRIVLAYGTHVMHVLHILLGGKWDPINLFDDEDLWISTDGFIEATSHAVSAAEAVNTILEFDPGLEFMPFFFGIYLLQGSFLLLLIADKLQLEASPNVVKACETIVRAHEACVVTLSTGYQRNFSKVMRSALAQVRGRVPEDLGEQHQRRRELLALYRWTGDGTGLAL